MNRLLFFTSDYAVGLTTALTEQVLEIHKVKELDLFCISSEKEMECGLHDRIHQAGIDMTIINQLDEHANFFQLSREIKNIISDKSITHVNVHNNWQLALVSYVKYMMMPFSGFKIIYTIHGYRHNSKWKSIPAIGIIGLALLLLSDRVISMSRYVSNKFWFLSYKMDIVYYMMLKPEFNKDENNISCDSLSIVYPAQFREGKNQDMIIRAIKRYIEETGDDSLKLYLAGDGVLLDACKKLVSEYQIEKNVLFTGKIPHEQVIQLYEQSNIALASANSETYGRCIAEPFALGRCLISRNTGVALDIVSHGVNGFIFDDEDDLVKILININRDKNIVSRVAQKAFEDKKVFSSDNVLNKYMEVIDKC